MRNFFTLVGAIILLAIATWFLLTFILISDERKVLRVIEKARYGVESGSVLSLANLLAPHYRHENELDRSVVLGAIQELFRQTNRLRVHILHASVRIEGDRASAQVAFLLSGLENGSLPEFQEQLTDPAGKGRIVQITFIREGRSWLIEQTSLQ